MAETIKPVPAAIGNKIHGKQTIQKKLAGMSFSCTPY
jgi:hypothetical protein